MEKTHKVTVISNSENFHFVPSNPWIAVGWRSRNDISFKIEPYLTRKNTDFIPVPVKEIKANNNQLLLVDEQIINYDYLVIPTGTPKTGYMIESMVCATAYNIADAIAGKEGTHEGSWNATCLTDMGDTGIAFVAMPQIPTRNIAWIKKGKWVHLAKVAFEKYFIKKMKKGTTENFYEKYILKAMGIKKLNYPPLPGFSGSPCQMADMG